MGNPGAVLLSPMPTTGGHWAHWAPLKLWVPSGAWGFLFKYPTSAVGLYIAPLGAAGVSLDDLENPAEKSERPSNYQTPAATPVGALTKCQEDSRARAAIGTKVGQSCYKPGRQDCQGLSMMEPFLTSSGITSEQRLQCRPDVF